MCAIAGTTKIKKDISKVVDSIKHRGPDDGGFLNLDNVTFGHKRLSVIDLDKRSSQPMRSDDGDFAITYNGEIYNFEELRKNLKDAGCFFKTEGDTEVILTGFKKEGIDFFKKMRGMWALAIYDRTRKEIVISRDRHGIKPLLYSVEGGCISFASEMKAMRLLVSDLSPNTERFYQLFSLGYFIAPETCFKNIKRVLPGEVLIFDSENAVIKEQININKDFEANIEYIKSPEETAHFLKESLLETIKSHMVSDVPVGVLFSGGTDSSLIAATMKDLGFSPKIFHVNVDGSLDNKYAKEISKSLGLNIEEIVLTKENFLAEYKDVFNHLDEPTGDISIIPTSAVYRHIKGKAKVVLSGEGGDELFGGYLRHRKLVCNDELIEKELPLNKFYGTNYFSLYFMNPIISRIRNKINYFRGDFVGIYLAETKIIDLPVQQQRLRKDLFYLFKSHNGFLKEPKALFFDRFMYLSNDLLYKNDIASMAFSVEARTPLVDQVLKEKVFTKINPKFCLSDKYKDKFLMKSVLSHYLSDDLVHRPKSGFGFSFHKYNIPELRQDIDLALAFHAKNKELFGLRKELNFKNSEMLIRKFPRFAFALVSNWKIFKDII